MMIERIIKIAFCPNKFFRHFKIFSFGSLIASNAIPVNMYGMEITRSIFSLHACTISKFSKLWMALCEPHPGH